MLHSASLVGDIHYIQNWSVADTTARDALSVAAGDVGRVCEVGAAGAEKTFYILADNSPMTWTEIGGGGAGTVTSVTSANADATVATTTTTPVITIVQAPALRSATTTVNVSSATAPTSGQVLTATSGTAATWQTPSAGSGITLGTPVTLTTQTSIDFTGIPSGTKAIFITLASISTNGASGYALQIGDSGGIETSGYSHVCLGMQEGVASFGSNYTTDFRFIDASGTAYVIEGILELRLLNSSTNTWACSTRVGYPLNSTQSVLWWGCGSKALSGELTQIRITTGNGTDQFDSGTLNIQYQS